MCGKNVNVNRTQCSNKENIVRHQDHPSARTQRQWSECALQGGSVEQPVAGRPAHVALWRAMGLDEPALYGRPRPAPFLGAAPSPSVLGSVCASLARAPPLLAVLVPSSAHVENRCWLLPHISNSSNMQVLFSERAHLLSLSHVRSAAELQKLLEPKALLVINSDSHFTVCVFCLFVLLFNVSQPQ